MVALEVIMFGLFQMIMESDVSSISDSLIAHVLELSEADLALDKGGFQMQDHGFGRNF